MIGDSYDLTNSEIALLKLSGLPYYQWVADNLAPDDVDIKSFDRLANIKRNINSFVRKSNNLLIISEHLGCGKTSWALKLLLAYINSHVMDIRGVDAQLVDNGYYIPGMFIQTVPFLVEMKQFGNNKNALQQYNRICETDLAVFDDIASVNMSQFDYNILYALVERRVFAGQSCIYTSNATTKDDLSKELGPRLADRIWESSIKVELKGHSYRGAR